jgi:integrase
VAARRSRGEGGVHWSESRNRWIATAQLGFQPNGKRSVKTATAMTKTAAKNRLKELLRDHDHGLQTSSRFTVANAIEDWLAFGLSGRSEMTVATCRYLATTHLLPDLGPRKLHELTAEEVDRWLARKSKKLSRATLQRLLSILRRAISRQQARDRIRRNVALLIEVPEGTLGRPSKSLSLEQSLSLLEAAAGSGLEGYIVLSLLTGVRTEELRALTWGNLDLTGHPEDDPPVPPSIQVWRSVRKGGDTKTRLSRRTLRLPARCVEALKAHRAAQDDARERAGPRWQDNDLVFCGRFGTPLDAANVRRSFRAIVKDAGLDPEAWTPRELRHSFVSIMSNAGVPLEDIARLVGHRSTTVTEAVYRKQLRPLITEGAEAMDRIFKTPGDNEDSDRQSSS